MMQELLDAVGAIGTDLDLPRMLERIVAAAAELADARYAALGVLLLLVLAMIWIVPKLFRFVRRLFDRLAGLGGVRTGMTGGAGDLERKA